MKLPAAAGGGGGATAAASDSEEEEQEEEGEEEQTQKVGAASPAKKEEDDGDRENDCAICLLEIEDDDGDWEHPSDNITLACSHTFHKPCFDLWKNNCREKAMLLTCPMCRVTVKHQASSSI